MGGTKIFVFQMKKLIRAAILALVGILALAAIIWLLLPKPHAPAAMYAPGTYAAQIVLHNKPVNVEVTLSEDKIIAVTLKDMEHAQELFYPLFKPTMETLSKEIVRKQSTGVGLSADNAVTGRILLDAVDAAIAQAKAIH